MATELQKMRALEDADYTYPEPWHKYEKCVVFIQGLAKIDKYSNEQLEKIINSTNSNEPAFIEAWVMIKCRNILEEIGEE